MQRKRNEMAQKGRKQKCYILSVFRVIEYATCVNCSSWCLLDCVVKETIFISLTMLLMDYRSTGQQKYVI